MKTERFVFRWLDTYLHSVGTVLLLENNLSDFTAVVLI